MNIPQQIKDLQLPADDMGLLLIDDIEEASQTFDRDEAEKLLEDDTGVDVPNTVSEYNQPGNGELLKDKQQQQASAAGVEVPNSVSEYNQAGNPESLTDKGEDNPAPAVKIVEATTASAAEEDKENEVPTPTEAPLTPPLPTMLNLMCSSPATQQVQPKPDQPPPIPAPQTTDDGKVATLGATVPKTNESPPTEPSEGEKVVKAKPADIRAPKAEKEAVKAKPVVSEVEKEAIKAKPRKGAREDKQPAASPNNDERGASSLFLLADAASIVRRMPRASKQMAVMKMREAGGAAHQSTPAAHPRDRPGVQDGAVLRTALPPLVLKLRTRKLDQSRMSAEPDIEAADPQAALPAPRSPSPPLPDGVFEVEKVVAFRAKAGRRPAQFLVKWVGFGPTHNEWRTEAQLRNAQQAVAEFLGRKRKMADGEEEKPKRLKKATSTALSTKKSTASARAVAKPSGSTMRVSMDLQDSTEELERKKKAEDVEAGGEEQMHEVEANGDEQMHEVEADGNEQMQEVEAAGTEQMNVVEAAGTVQMDVVEEAGAVQMDVVEEAGAVPVGAAQPPFQPAPALVPPAVLPAAALPASVQPAVPHPPPALLAVAPAAAQPPAAVPAPNARNSSHIRTMKRTATRKRQHARAMEAKAAEALARIQLAVAAAQAPQQQHQQAD